jgi:hypothetical protein
LTFDQEPASEQYSEYVSGVAVVTYTSRANGV